MTEKDLSVPKIASKRFLTIRLINIPTGDRLPYPIWIRQSWLNPLQNINRKSRVRSWPTDLLCASDPKVSQELKEAIIVLR